jgi:S1-C subfamily serine protease
MLLPSVALAQTRILQHYSTGTGFFVGDEGYVVTGNHVISACDSYTVYAQNATMQATLVARDVSQDIVVLKTTFPALSVASFRTPTQTLIAGDALWVFGYPGNAWKNRKAVFKKSQLLESAGMGGEGTLMQFTESVQQGNSGGPLLDKSGNVVGMITAKSSLMLVNKQTNETKTIKKADIALNLPTILSFLEAHHIPFKTEYSDVTLSADQLQSAAQRFVVNIRCRVD